MEKMLAVGGRRIPLKLTADSLFVYKSNFSRDGFADISGESSRDAITLLRFLWAFAKNKSADTEPLDEWIGKNGLNDAGALAQALPEVADMLAQFSRSSVKPKNVSTGKNTAGERATTETIIRRAVERGLSVSDFGDFTLGMIIDYLVTCQNEDYDAKQNLGRAEGRRATQNDIDAF